MIVTTAAEVEGRAIADYLGLVRGIVVRVPTRRQRIRGRAETFWDGGSNPFFLEVAEGAREDAYAELVKHAEGLGADAVVGARYETTPFMADGVSEVLVYGTAVRLAP